MADDRAFVEELNKTLTATKSWTQAVGTFLSLVILVTGWYFSGELRSIRDAIQTVGNPGLVGQARRFVQDDDADALTRASGQAFLMHSLNGQTAAAIAKMRAIVTVVDGIDNQRAAQAWFSIGTLHQSVNANKEALAAYDAAISLRIDYLEAYVNRAIVNGALQLNDAALRDYEAALLLQPDDARVYVNRGNLYADLEQYDNARQDLARAVELAQASGNSDVVREAQDLIEGFPASQ